LAHLQQSKSLQRALLQIELLQEPIADPTDSWVIPSLGYRLLLSKIDQSIIKQVDQRFSGLRQLHNTIILALPAII
jgi:hypothetical protein